MTLSRRHLMALAAGASMVPAGPGVRVALGAEPSPKKNIFVFVFLRDGMDGLQLVAPADEGCYRDARRNIGVRSDGFGAGSHLGALDNVPFFLNPVASRLKAMYDNKSLAIIHAAGIPTPSRSHFESQELIERGIASNEPVPTTGWLTRHMRTRVGVPGDFPATADVTTGGSALFGAPAVAPTDCLEGMPYSLYPERAAIIAAMNKGNSAAAKSARDTLKLVSTIRERSASLPPRDDSNNGSYTYGGLSQSLKSLGRILKINIGVEVAVVDFQALDTHQNIAQNFTNAARELSAGLYGFTQDMGDSMQHITIVAMTEFGRRLEENTNGGTDHGAASVMLALGAGVNGGRIYGQWPGLSQAQLDNGDLRVTTDYRQVLAELLVKRMGQSAIDQVFPNIRYNPLGIAREG